MTAYFPQDGHYAVLWAPTTSALRWVPEDDPLLRSRCRTRNGTGRSACWFLARRPPAATSSSLCGRPAQLTRKGLPTPLNSLVTIQHHENRICTSTGAPAPAQCAIDVRHFALLIQEVSDEPSCHPHCPRFRAGFGPPWFSLHTFVYSGGLQRPSRRYRLQVTWALVRMQRTLCRFSRAACALGT
jgi:hypothetical protein